MNGFYFDAKAIAFANEIVAELDPAPFYSVRCINDARRRVIASAYKRGELLYKPVPSVTRLENMGVLKMCHMELLKNPTCGYEQHKYYTINGERLNALNTIVQLLDC